VTFPRLTDREVEYLDLLASGYRQSDIAHMRGVTIPAISKVSNRIRRKIGLAATGRGALKAWCLLNGWGNHAESKYSKAA